MRVYKKKYDHELIYHLVKNGSSYEEIQKMFGDKLKGANIFQIVRHQELLEELNKKEREQKDG